MNPVSVYKFAVIGCGLISRCHINAILKADDAVLTGVYDKCMQQAERTAEQYKVRCYSSYEEVLNDVQIDAVCICTPSFLHAELARQAIIAGKSVLVEKPLALNMRDCDEIIALAQKHHVLAGVVSQLRFAPEISRVKKAIENGVLGRMTRADLYMKYYRPPEYYAESTWRGTVEKDGGGALINQGIHGVDLLRYIMGPVKSIYAVSGTLAHDIEVEDTLTAVISYKNGPIGVIEASTADWPGAPRRIELNGEYGRIVLEENRITEWKVKGEETFGIYEETPPQSGTWQDAAAIDLQGHIHQLNDFISALRGDTSLSSDAVDAKKTLEIIFSAYVSAETGEAVEI